MNYKKWNEILNNKEYHAIIQDIQENIVDEWNFEDTSVGIYSIDEIDNDLVNLINEEYEACIVKESTKDMIKIIVDEIYLVTIQLQKIDFETYEWNIVDFSELKRYIKFTKNI